MFKRSPRRGLLSTVDSTERSTILGGQRRRAANDAGWPTILGGQRSSDPPNSGGPMRPTVTRAMRVATGRSLRRAPRGWRCVFGRNFIATCGFNLELMRCHLPDVRRHSTVDLVGVIDFGRPHLTGGVGETANVKEAEANFFDDESVLSP